MQAYEYNQVIVLPAFYAFLFSMQLLYRKGVRQLHNSVGITAFFNCVYKMNNFLPFLFF